MLVRYTTAYTYKGMSDFQNHFDIIISRIITPFNSFLSPPPKKTPHKSQHCTVSDQRKINLNIIIIIKKKKGIPKQLMITMANYVKVYSTVKSNPDGNDMQNSKRYSREGCVLR
jgi:hypothetical protein